MTTEEKKQIYLDRFPAIIGKRMAEQVCLTFIEWPADYYLPNLIIAFNYWTQTKENYGFWESIYFLYNNNEVIEHHQLLDIFHKHGIKP